MAKKSTPQVWLEYLAVRAVFGFLGVLPRGVAINLGVLLGRLGFHSIKSLRRVAYRNLQIALPKLSEAERTGIVKGSFENIGRVLAELSRFPKATTEGLEKLIKIEFDPALLAEYEKLQADGNRGTIIISPHLGNWELLVFAWSAVYEPISYLARPLDNPLIEDFTVRLRTRFGNRPINKTNSAGSAIRILREGGRLGVLPDVNSHPKDGVFVPFFGVQACTTSGVAMLAMRTNAIILPMCGVWKPETGTYKLVHGGIVLPASTGNRQQDVIDTTAVFTQEIEKLIRQFPDQWLWTHKRWKTRPPGEEKLYD